MFSSSSSSSSSSASTPPFSNNTTSTTMVLNEIENSKPHVLAVDDSLVDRIIIEKLLINYACKVTTVENAERALEILGLTKGKETLSDNNTESQVNMIITDYCMPGMSGYELLKKIKESPAMKEIPVIVVSSDNIPTRITKCLEEGAQEFLLKPLKQSDVKKLSCHLHKLKNLCNEMLCVVTPIN